MYYVNIIFDRHLFAKIFSESSSPFKEQYLSIYNNSIKYLKTLPEIWDRDSIHFHVEDITKVERSHFLKHLEQNQEKIVQFVGAQDGKVISGDVSFLLDDLISADEFSVHCLIYCIDALVANDCSASNILFVSKVYEQIKSSSLLRDVFYWAEECVDAATAGQKKANVVIKDKLNNDPALIFSKSFAINLWKLKPELNSSAITKLTLYAMQEILDAFKNEGCNKFINFNLYEPKDTETFEEESSYLGGVQKSEKYYKYNSIPHFEDDAITCVPIELPKFSKLRSHLEKLAPDTITNARITDYSSLEELVNSQISCTANNCSCK